MPMASLDIYIIMVGALVGTASSLLGTFLVLRKSSMLSDAISHSILLGIVLTYLLTKQTTGPLFIVGAALAGILTVYLTELLTQTKRVKNDAAIGLVFPALFSLAVILINLYARDVHIDIDAVLFGEIGFIWLDTQTLAGFDVPVSLISMGIIALVNLGFVSIFYKELKLSTFDAALATALGFSPSLLFYALLSLTSITAVAAFDAVGAILLVAFIIIPPSAAYLLTDKLWRMIAYSIAISLGSSISGYYLAVAWDVSIAGMMAVMTGLALILAFLFSPAYGLIAQEYLRRSQRFANYQRALLVHLYNHENTNQDAEENVANALREHLGWNETRIRDTLMRSLDDNLVIRTGDSLSLSPKGRAIAQEIMEPWQTRQLPEKI